MLVDPAWLAAVKKANGQVDWCVALAKKYVLPWWGATLLEFPSPLWPSLMALYWAHESAKKYRLGGKLVFAPARHVRTNYPEIGPANLTCKPGDDEVRRLDVHPFHVRSHQWAAQQAFWEGVAYVSPRLVQYGFSPFPDLAIYDQVSLLLLQRAVGLGCTRGILRRASKLLAEPLWYESRRMPVVLMERWLSGRNADTTPFDGSQTTATVRLRFAWCTRMVHGWAEVGLDDLPPAISPPLPRPSDIVPMPRDFRANMRAYANRARREGPMPTGPYPAGPYPG